MTTLTIPNEASMPARDTRSRVRSANDFVAVIRSLLDEQEFLAARHAAARAVERFSGHPWLELANRVLNPTRIVRRPADDGPQRRKEFDWLRRNSERYRGKWIALVGDELIASGSACEEVLRAVRARNLAVRPLVHHVV